MSNRDLLTLAQARKLNPLIGGTHEIEKLIEVISQPTSNSLMLLGMPGVGKSAIVAGLAQHIVKGKVPAFLLDKHILRFEFGRFFDPNGSAAEGIANFKRLVEEIKVSGNIIYFSDMAMFFDLPHPPPEINLTDIIISSFESRDIVCIAEITPDQLATMREIEPSFLQYFNLCQIAEPSLNETLNILRGVKSTYEVHHNITITDEAIQSALQLSVRFMPERFLPDKAIDLVDEACARLRFAKRHGEIFIRRVQAELADIAEELETFSETMTDAHRQELKKRESELSTELISLQVSLNNPIELRLTADNISSTVRTWHEQH